MTELAAVPIATTDIAFQFSDLTTARFNIRADLAYLDPAIAALVRGSLEGEATP